MFAPTGPSQRTGRIRGLGRPLLRAAAAYFGLVFAVGFALGIWRTLLLAPRLGERWAELLEMPLMVGASYLAARWVVRRFAVPRDARSRLYVGFAALGLLLIAELLVVLLVQRASLAEYVAGRDPISGAVYLLALLLFALMPWLVGRS